VDRRSFLAGILVSLPFTLSVALLCTTSDADELYRPLSVATMSAVFVVMFAFQIGCGVRAFRGAPLARPLAAYTAAYLSGVFAVMLAGDFVVRLVKPEFLPAGLPGTVVLWAGVLVPMAGVAALSAITVSVGAVAARARLRTGWPGTRVPAGDRRRAWRRSSRLPVRADSRPPWTRTRLGCDDRVPASRTKPCCKPCGHCRAAGRKVGQAPASLT